MVVGAIVVALIFIIGRGEEKIKPVKIELPLLDGVTIMKKGTSRVLELFYFSGNDNRTSDDFQIVTARNVAWSVSPPGIISVDDYGRV